LIRLIRLVRAYKSVKKLVSHIYKDKAQGILTSVFILAILIVVISSVAILQVETGQDSNIKTAEDAIWWTYSTITTVGYGDRYPVTSEGRVIAMVLMTFGVGLFGTFTAFVSSHFVRSNSN
jgi:voltage-gated potassium channel